MDYLASFLAFARNLYFLARLTPADLSAAWAAISVIRDASLALDARVRGGLDLFGIVAKVTPTPSDDLLHAVLVRIEATGIVALIVEAADRIRKGQSIEDLVPRAEAAGFRRLTFLNMVAVQSGKTEGMT